MKLFGNPSFTLDGTAVTADTRKASALLAYLVVEGPSARDVLAALLWSESPHSRARATLRRTLSAIRSAMGPNVLLADRNHVRLHAGVRADVTTFEKSLAAADQHSHIDRELCPACTASLQAAVDAYCGDFLAGFYLRDSPEFDDWTRQTAESYRLACERAYERLSIAFAAQGDYRRAIDAAHQWLELDRLREPAYRQLMLLNAWAGDRAAAAETYRRCLTTLNRELGVDPLAETTELYDAVLDDDLPPSPGPRRPAVPQPSLRPSPPPDLVDRRHELEVLARAMTDQPGGTVIRLVGEAWMGKTRLIEEARSLAEEQGRPVVAVRGYRAERQLPFGVVAQALGALTNLPDWKATRGTVPAWARRETARIYPDLGPGPATGSDTFAETRLYDALLRVLTAGPIVYLVDDTHWVDESSLAVLTYLVNRITSTGTLVVFAHRPEEDRNLGSLVEAAAMHGPPLVLEPLTPAAIPDTDDADSIIARTGGIPVLVAEALAGGGGATPTPGVRRFMKVRLADLDELSRQVLAAASVLSGSSDFDLLREVSGRSEEEVIAAAEALTARRILTTSGDGELDFSLATMKQLVYEETSLIRRRLLHRRAAETLDTRPRAQTDAVLATAIAQHHQRGGQDERAAEWYVRAGRLAREVFAPAEAIRSFQTALALGRSDEAEVRIDLGDTLLFMGRFSRAVTEFEIAASLTEGPARAVAGHRIGEANRRLGRLDVALERFALAERDHPDPVSLYCDWALALLRRGERKAAREKADRAVVASEKAGAAGRSRALAVLGIVSGHRAEARRSLMAALELAGNDPILRMAALNALAHSHAQSDEHSDALMLVDEALRLAAAIGDRHRQAALYNHLADLYHRMGRDADSEAALKEAVKLFVEVEPGAWEPEVWLLTWW